MKKLCLIAAIFMLTCSVGCSKGSSGASDDKNQSRPTDTAFTIRDEGQLIGGPIATGKVGDILLKNDKIRVVIQKPTKNSFINTFGGVIIDADVVRADGTGQDNFGSIFPMINIEWTVNYQELKVIEDGSKGGRKVVRAKGMIDVYEYLDFDFIGAVAKGFAGQELSFSNRFDDRANPFEIYEDLKGVNKTVTTDYILEDGKNYVRVETTITNDGDKDVKMPVGVFVNNSGENSLLIPGTGFSPALAKQIAGSTPALIFPAFGSADVSYGIFYDPRQFEITDEKGVKKIPDTASITYSAFTAIAMGETLLKLLPLGRGGTPSINFTIKPKSSRTLTHFFVVADGSGGSLMDYGTQALKIQTRSIKGKVVDKEKKPVENAIVAVQNASGGGTIITYRTDASGGFSGELPTGLDEAALALGSGKYKFLVDYDGYHVNATTRSGECTPETADLRDQNQVEITCTLGESTKIQLSSPITIEGADGASPARMTIVGEDPSPNKSSDAGIFYDTIIFEKPFGVMDIKYITSKGTFDLTDKNYFHIEPGFYRIFVTKGPEYSHFEKLIEAKTSETIKLDKIILKHVNPTKGYIAADMHVHCINSPDSALTEEMRVLSAVGEGLDILQSTDHDFLTDYSKTKRELEIMGLIPANSIQTSIGDEITPNHFGHIQAYPLSNDERDPDHGAIDWSYSPMDEISTSPDYGMTIDEIIDEVRKEPGETVIQINHIMDMPTGIFAANGWVTSPHFDVPLLSTYGDPVEQRMVPASSYTFPLPFGTSGLMATRDFDAVELLIGYDMNNVDLLFRSSLPTWFNLLNIGKIVTAVADSDSHTIHSNPIGLPRNFIAHSTDPRDNPFDSYSNIDLQEYARSIKEHKVVMSTGPFIEIEAKNKSGDIARIGDTITGKSIELEINVSAPSWAWFDTIEIYMNTDPIPVDDKTDEPMKGTAANPATFYAPYHIPRYTYQPTKSFSRLAKTLEGWKEEDGRITAAIKEKIVVDQDTWIVVMARGKKETPGYRSLFPIIPDVLIDPKKGAQKFDVKDLSSFHTDENVSAQAWCITNPIFIDVDGNGFESKYKMK